MYFCTSTHRNQTLNAAGADMLQDDSSICTFALVHLELLYLPQSSAVPRGRNTIRKTIIYSTFVPSPKLCCRSEN
jgi:hypothetical protein